MTKNKPSIGPSLIDWYTVGSAARISGLSEDMVNYLCRHGIVSPSGASGRGRGRARRYTYSDILLLRILAKLLEQGISVLRLKKCFTTLQKRGGDIGELVSKKFVATDGHDIYFEDQKVLELLRTGQMAFAFVLELSGLRKEVQAKIAMTSRQLPF